jgi:hypothetical protein
VALQRFFVLANTCVDDVTRRVKMATLLDRRCMVASFTTTNYDNSRRVLCFQPCVACGAPQSPTFLVGTDFREFVGIGTSVLVSLVALLPPSIDAVIHYKLALAAFMFSSSTHTNHSFAFCSL